MEREDDVDFLLSSELNDRLLSEIMDWLPTPYFLLPNQASSNSSSMIQRVTLAFSAKDHVNRHTRLTTSPSRVSAIIDRAWT